MRPKLLSWQSYALSALCLADLASTVWLCHVHDASEGNPMMAFFLAQGVAAFAAAKIAMTAVPLGVLEWARRVQPKLGFLALNTALLGYLTLYAAGIAHVNGGAVSAEERKAAQDNRAHVVFLENQRRNAAKRALRIAEADPKEIVRKPAQPPAVLRPNTPDMAPLPPPG
jgi:hypothetical protein